MPRKFRVIGRHKWVAGCTISESVNQDDTVRRYIATIKGSRNWRLYEGPGMPGLTVKLMAVVMYVRDHMDEKDADIFELDNRLGLVHTLRDEEEVKENIDAILSVVR